MNILPGVNSATQEGTPRPVRPLYIHSTVENHSPNSTSQIHSRRPFFRVRDLQGDFPSPFFPVVKVTSKQEAGRITN